MTMVDILLQGTKSASNRTILSKTGLYNLILKLIFYRMKKQLRSTILLEKNLNILLQYLLKLTLFTGYKNTSKFNIIGYGNEDSIERIIFYYYFDMGNKEQVVIESNQGKLSIRITNNKDKFLIIDDPDRDIIRNIKENIYSNALDVFSKTFSIYWQKSSH